MSHKTNSVLPLSGAGKCRLPGLCSPLSVLMFPVVSAPEMKIQSHSLDSSRVLNKQEVIQVIPVFSDETSTCCENHGCTGDYEISNLM